MGETAKEVGHIEPRILTRADILQADDLPRELVEVPEWGGSLYVYSMTGTERDAFEDSTTEIRQVGRGKPTVKHRFDNIRAKMCARCIKDEDGVRLFTEEDVEALGRKSAKALDRVFAVAQRLNGFSQEDLEELAGN